MGLRRSSLVVWAALIAVGLYAASPFLSRGLVGTGEAYNYSLSVGDALAQMHAGIVPPLAGQSEWAFNGRIHPLRNAPYLHYLAAAVNELTLHRLTFWQIQNVSLVLSIVGAAIACYVGIRWSTSCRRDVALFLASLYVICPPLLSSAHTLNLFMTVHAAVFIPLAVAGCIRACRLPSFRADALMAAAVAAAWLAHPPVALWLTASVFLFRLGWFLAHPEIRIFINGLVAILVGSALASFVFVSTGTMRQDLGILSGDASLWDSFAAVIFKNLQNGFPACLLPVTRMGGELGDIQLGYVPYLLLGLCLFAFWQRQPHSDRNQQMSARLASTSITVSGLLLLLLMPVPVFTFFVWKHLPVMVYKLTTEWPIQRIYLIALAYLLFGAATLLPSMGAKLKLSRWFFAALGAMALAWSGYEAQAFIDRGFANRLSEKDTNSSYRSSNRSLTITSYAFVGPPPTFVHGVMDPAFQFRLLKGGQTETTSQTSAALATGTLAERGMLKSDKGLSGADIISSPNIRLLPHHRYLFTFKFLTPPLHGLLYFVGPLLNRVYILPEAGEAKGFGMLPGESHSIPVWTDSASSEDIQVHVWISDKGAIPLGATNLAGYVVQDIDLDKLPVRIDAPYPLRFTVDAPSIGYTVETPRRFIPGYSATVNGRAVTPLLSPYGQVMIALPAGHNVVDLVYRGPLAARFAFWFCTASWALFLAWCFSGRATKTDPYSILSHAVASSSRFLRTLPRGVMATLFALASTVLVVALGVRTWRLHHEFGPLLVDFELPYGRKGLNEPLLSTGHKVAGVVVFANIIDERTIRLEADVWGRLYQSEPLEVDFSQPHRLVVSDGALIPLNNAAVQNMTESDRASLRKELRIELDGHVAIHTAADTFDSEPGETVVGSAPFGSLTETTYPGRILRVARLTLPTTLLLPKSLKAYLDLQRPAGLLGKTEPILSILKGVNTRLLAITDVEPGHTRLNCSDGEGNILQSVVLPIQEGAIIHLEIAYVNIGEKTSLSVWLDGVQIIVQPDSSAFEAVPILTSGLNMTANRAVEARFTGGICALRVEHSGMVKIGSDEPASADLVLTFPADRVGRQEPIVTTGRTGAGDLLYVIYADPQHVKVGFDHWNGGGAVSQLIPIDYNNPHEFLIKMDSMQGDGIETSVVKGGKQSATMVRPGVLVLLDGVKAIDSRTTPYPSSTHQVTFAHNLIGGSTADRDFSGIIHFLATDRGVRGDSTLFP